MSGEASGNSLGNLVMARVLSPDDVEEIVASQRTEGGTQQQEELTPEEGNQPQPDLTSE
jgi:hypothetical protein